VVEPDDGGTASDKLPEETRLAQARLPDHGDHLTMPPARPVERAAELLRLCGAAGEAREPPPRRGLEPGTGGAGPHQIETSIGSASPLIGTGPSAVTWPKPSAKRSVSAVSRMLPGAASCSMRAARCVVWPTAV
jgi:hypothetical protein